ncbi:SMI1/KNR4 family protein [Humisphaera borealis]|uniref:SMI1/KNR4 family protein n=1 Tax=Humisphaera borealis TaxID=2807512 RepID=A0A7M2WT87_9BACT|nr:SMI1/KNR4 family protein [Humisphaera borealis]QOV88382.1 SMI1/KNR4 family protein [Humisphaera borealis]
MKIEDVQVAEKPLVLATAADLDTLASRLWITFPSGYREYVMRLGEGVLGGSFVRIYPPWRIEKELPEWRRRINKYWFWAEGRELLPKERALECVLIGDTVNGDELVFHPSRPNRLLVLPRESEQIFDAGGDLLDAIEWMCTSGELVERFDERKFEPFDSRVDSADRASEVAAADPEGESLDDLVELAERWTKRHAVKETARKQLRQQTPKGGKAELIYEGILIDGSSKLDVGYGVAWRINDKETGKLLGVFRWRKGDGHQGSAYEPAKGA